MKFIDLSSQYKKIEKNLVNNLSINFKNTDFIMGDNIKLLEKKLLKLSGSKYCITCANGTDALSIALMSIDLKVNEVVFVPSFTYVSTAESVSQLRGKPFFVDVSKDDYNIDIKSLEASIKTAKKKNLKMKAIIAVDLFGMPCNRNKLKKIAKKNNLILIIDAAQGFGSNYNKSKFAEIGDIVTTSFFPTKPLGCYGDGGALFTNNKNLSKKMFSLRVHGSGENKYDNVLVGMNSRLDTIQATILLEKIKIFKSELKLKNEIFKKYNGLLSSKFKKTKTKKGIKSAMALYTLRHDKRDDLLKYLKFKGIPAAIYYSKPLHLQKAYKKYPKSPDKCQNSIELSKKVFSIPFHAYLSKKDIKKVIDTLNTFN